MKGLDVKRGVSATMERVVGAAGEKIKELEVLWAGRSAGIKFSREYDGLHIKVIFPSLDDKANIDRVTFNNLIGYALHEGLGHAMFTDNAPWDNARDKYGAFMHQLINGLEDPRIEQCAIDSGFAPNSKLLFEDLLNSVLAADGYVEPDDIKNIPFLCAVEGRRLNGYQVNAPSILDASPLSAQIRKALLAAQASPNTAGVVAAALELHKAIQKHQRKQQKPTQSDDGQPQQGANAAVDTQGSPTPNKSPTDDSGESEQALPCGRSVEPTEFINRKMVKHKSTLGGGFPAIGTPELATFEWS